MLLSLLLKLIWVLRGVSRLSRLSFGWLDIPFRRFAFGNFDYFFAFLELVKLQGLQILNTCSFRRLETFSSWRLWKLWSFANGATLIFDILISWIYSPERTVGAKRPTTFFLLAPSRSFACEALLSLTVSSFQPTQLLASRKFLRALSRWLVTFFSLSFYFARNLKLSCLRFTSCLFYENSTFIWLPIMDSVCVPRLLACINKIVLEIGDPGFARILSISIWVIRTILRRNYMGLFAHEGCARRQMSQVIRMQNLWCWNLCASS